MQSSTAIGLNARKVEMIYLDVGHPFHILCFLVDIVGFKSANSVTDHWQQGIFGAIQLNIYLLE